MPAVMPPAQPSPAASLSTAPLHDAARAAPLQAADAVVGLVALTFAALLVRLCLRHTLWYDEAMLVTNIAEGTLGDLFGPLPFYDQAAPQLYLLLLKAVHGVFGVNEIALRMPAWLAAAAAVFILVRWMPGLDALERACAAAVLIGGYTFAYLTTEAKPYTGEVLVSCALMAFFQSTGPLPLPAVLTRLGVLLVAMASASTFPLVALAVGAQAHLRGVRKPGDIRRLVLPRLASTGWIFAAAGIVYVLYYLLHIKPAYQAILGNFGYTYESFGYARTASYPVWLVAKVWEILESHYAIISIVVLAAIPLGLLPLRGRGTAYPVQAGVLFAAMIGLNAIGVFPILPARFSVFILPWLAVFAGAGMAMLLARLTDRVVQLLAATGLALVVMVPALVSIVSPITHPAGRSVALLRSAPAGPIMVTVSAQPAFDIYVKPPVGAGADRCMAPSVLGYTNRCRALKAPGDGVFVGRDTKWYLLNYASVIGRGLEPVGFPGPSPRAFVDSYLDWLSNELPIGKPVLLFTAAPTPRDSDADPLQARLKTIATVERLVDDRIDVDSSRAGRIDRVLRSR